MKDMKVTSYCVNTVDGETRTVPTVKIWLLTCSHAVGNSTDNHFIRFEESKGNHFAGNYTKEAVGADKWFAIH